MQTITKELREGDVAKGVPISPASGRFTFDGAATDLENVFDSRRAFVRGSRAVVWPASQRQTYAPT